MQVWNIIYGGRSDKKRTLKKLGGNENATAKKLN